MSASFNTLPFHIQQSAFNPTLAMKYLCVHSCLERDLQRASLQAFLVALIFTKYKCACWRMLENRLYKGDFIIIFLSRRKLSSNIFCICVNCSNCILQNNQIECMTHLLYFVAVDACFQSGVTVTVSRSHQQH